MQKKCQLIFYLYFCITEVHATVATVLQFKIGYSTPRIWLYGYCYNWLFVICLNIPLICFWSFRPLVEYRWIILLLFVRFRLPGNRESNCSNCIGQHRGVPTTIPWNCLKSWENYMDSTKTFWDFYKKEYLSSERKLLVSN